jgi:hypothetical protein
VVEEVSLPTRVIDVGSLSNPGLFIYESHGTLGQWLALSHCCGGYVIGSTTTENITKRKHCLQWNEVARNFQDAIFITRALGYRYLWVDSLCIFQDSHSDSVYQSTQIAYIFQNAVLTIAADKADNSSRGFLPQPACGIKTVALNYHSLLGNIQGIIYLRPNLDIDPNEPLQRRAWALQENILSPRTLYFTDRQLV